MSSYYSIGEAIQIGTLTDVQQFIKDGADVNKRDGSRRLPLDYCVSDTWPCSCTSKVTDSAGDVSQAVLSLPLCSRCRERLEKAKLLLDSGTDPNNTDGHGWGIVHQCAWSGDLLLLRMCVQKGGKVTLRTKDQRLPVHLSATRSHMHTTRYLDKQSCDIRSLCRVVINDSMGKRRYNRLNELPVPPTVRLYLNFNIPYIGFEATLVPTQPWTLEELHSRSVESELVQEFICENASSEFLEEHKDVLVGVAGNGEGGGAEANMTELIELFQTMYLWESFKNVKFEEQPARAPRYSMEKLKKEEKLTSGISSGISEYIRRLRNK